MKLHLKEGIRLYELRIKRYVDFKIQAIRNEKIRISASAEVVLKREAERILGLLDKREYVVALDASDIPMSSETFSSFLRDRHDRGLPTLTFILGSSLGLRSKVLDRANHRLSLSSMIFTHEMARLLLLEQIYRAMTIMSGERYHK